jgi:enoyl-CoA hydratase/carnithine racemase
VTAGQPTAPGADPDGWVRTARDGAVLTVTLDRADQLNAQTPATWAALRAVGENLDDEVRVVVVTGAGRAFSAGLDRSLFSPEPGVPGGLGALGALSTDAAEERIRGYQAGFRWLRTPGIVSIAAVQGHAIGAGAQLALACDLRVLTEDAQLRLPEATLGLVPDLTGTSTLVELVGYSRAVDICLTGRAVGAAEALAMGLANAVVPADRLAGAVRELTGALLAVDAGASRETLALVRSAVRNDPAAQDAAERAAQVRRLQVLAVGRGAVGRGAAGR